MAVLSVAVPQGVDLKLTENYLLNLIGVTDASVWWKDGEMHAYVSLLDEAVLAARDVQLCCAEDLGVHQCPRHVTLSIRRKLVA